MPNSIYLLQLARKIRLLISFRARLRLKKVLPKNKMNKYTRIIQTIFGVPWIIFGTQHFLYVDFVANIIPAYFPVRPFWAYLTGAAMIAAGISLVTGVKARLAAALLGVMLLAFFVLIQVPKIIGIDSSAVAWTRIFQDAAIAASAFMLAEILSKRTTDEQSIFSKIGKISRYIFAALLIVFGVQQFFNLDFLTAKVPEYFPFRILWVYLVGIAMIATGASVLINKKARQTAIALGIFLLLINLLRYLPLFISGAYNALILTAAMLDLTIICGVFILARVLPKKQKLVDNEAEDQNQLVELRL